MCDASACKVFYDVRGHTAPPRFRRSCLLPLLSQFALSPAFLSCIPLMSPLDLIFHFLTEAPFSAHPCPLGSTAFVSDP